MNTTPDPYSDWDAAYVLGLLSAADRRRFELHLQDCPACATAVAELAGMPALLGAISADEAVALTSGGSLAAAAHAPSMVGALARRVGRRRRLRRVLAGAAGLAAAVLLVTSGVAIGSTGSVSPPVATASHAPLLAMTPVKATTMSARLGVTEKGWGTRLDWVCEYGTQSGYDGSYELVVTTIDGEEHRLGSWTTTSGPQAGDLSASTSLHTSEIASIDIRRLGADSALVETRL